jgi:hypothetical protein
MKNRKTIIAGMFLLLLFVVGWTGYGQKAARQQWEYKMLYLPDESSEEASLKTLNTLGAEGWEVIEFHQRGIDTLSGQYLFKRSK